MAKFNTLTIKDITRETADSVSVAFNVPDNLKEEYKIYTRSIHYLKTFI
ncbi:MAG: hypothetical protein KatS3mg035_1409 [Bacteroidia bacterium]|nr:MAG: hypothetical protein KatS3mg035_1409 [Bacteroidia bacterium]